MNSDDFWKRVDRREATECWDWTGHVNSDGYGIVGMNSKTVRTHRVAWLVTYGPIPDGMSVCHKCDNRRCANPSHLFVAPQAENVHDMIAKGRAHYVRGEKIGNHRLTEEVVRMIHASKQSSRALARLLGVGASTVMDVRRGNTWCHVPALRAGGE